MIDLPGIFAIDGHDGSGKTTLAHWLASQTNASFQQPFRGEPGSALLRAASGGDASKVTAVGQEAVMTAIAAAGTVRPVILDRAWMTVASLVEWKAFGRSWRLWMSTVLCWADLPTTLDRLAQRSEPGETVDWHSHYIELYRSLAERTGSYVIRTDVNSTSESCDLLLRWFKRNPLPPKLISGIG